MQLISCHAGELRTLSAMSLTSTARNQTFRTGMQPWDGLLAGKGFARGAVHEFLMPAQMGKAMFVGLLLAKEAAGEEKQNLRSFLPIIWCDSSNDFYPPAASAAGIPLKQLYLLRAGTVADENWAVAECLRCRGVGAVVASPRRLSRIEARRLQLAAEQGGSVGILLRPTIGSSEYAAASRWLVTPIRGERTMQRWKLQLIHGHGGRVGETVILEFSRETHSVRAIDKLADRPDVSSTEESKRAIA